MTLVNGNASAAYLLIKTRLRAASGDFDVADVREEVANAVTNAPEDNDTAQNGAAENDTAESDTVYSYRRPGGEMLPPDSAIVLAGPIHVIVPLVAEDDEAVADLVRLITVGGDGIPPIPNIDPAGTMAIYVTQYFQKGCSPPGGVPVFPEMAKPVEFRERSMAYVLVKTEPGRAVDVATRASEIDTETKPGLKIATYDKSGMETLNLSVAGEALGVRWAAVIAETDSSGEAVPFQVLLHLNTLDNDHQGRALAAIRRIPYVANPTGITANSVHEGGAETKAARNGPPR